MSRRNGDSIRSKILPITAKSISPRTSVYERLGPPGMAPQPIKSDQTCRYILKNGHCRIGCECNYDHSQALTLISSTPSVDVSQIPTCFVDTNPIIPNESHCQTIFQDEKISSPSIAPKLLEIDQIKNNIRRHISGSSKTNTLDDNLHRDLSITKNSRGNKQMGSVVQRGCKNSKIQATEDQTHFLENHVIKPLNAISTLSHASFETEPNLSSDSFCSGEEKDSSSDSVSGNEQLALGSSNMKDSKEKALSSISESSFSSLQSSDKNFTDRKKKDFHKGNRTPKERGDKTYDRGSKKGSKSFRSSHCNSHKYLKKHYKRSKSISEESPKYKKERHKEKKRQPKSNQGIEDSKHDSMGERKKVKSIRTAKLCSSNIQSMQLDVSSVSATTSIKQTSFSSNISHEGHRFIVSNDTNSFDSSLSSQPDKSSIDSAPKYVCSSKASVSENTLPTEVASTINVTPISNSIISHCHDNFCQPNNLFSNRTEDTNRDASKLRNIVSAQACNKRKQTGKVHDAMDKKFKHCEILPVSKHDIHAKKCKLFGKSFNHMKSISASPSNTLKDSSEIYDSLSDVDQGNVLEEELTSNILFRYNAGSHFLDLDWASVKYGSPLAQRASTISPNCLLSQVGLSYSLLGPDIFRQCLNSIFEDGTSLKMHHQGLTTGAVIEDILFLEKEKLSIPFGPYSENGFVKSKDMYLRDILSGSRGSVHSNPISLSSNNYLSVCMKTDFFHSVLNLYHCSGST